MMKRRITLCLAAMGMLFALTVPARAQLLYSENFDDGMAANRWRVNTTGLGLDVPTGQSKPMDTNFDLDADGIVDDLSGFAFDYDSIGIPPAPNSNGSTVGLKLQANLFSDAFGGFSVSPLDQSFTGDYVLSYDMWQNYNGPLDSGFNGTTNLSYGGVLTSGTTSNYAGASDSVFFGSTGDGDSGADYRAYSIDRQISYQVPAAEPQDDAAIYFAESRNNTAAYYKTNINPEIDPVNMPNVGTVTAPAAQLALFPQQTGAVRVGAMGMAWYHHEITKIGTVITWSVNGVDLIEVDTSKFVGNQPAGNNILFGHSDTGQGSSTDFNAQFLLFTLVDNVEVNAIVAGDPGDFDNDGDVDGRDFLVWQRGDSPNPLSAEDLADWQAHYGGDELVALSSVPEPGSASMILALASLLGLRRSTR